MPITEPKPSSIATAGAHAASDPRPRVVMLVANHFRNDTRVYKEARSLIEWGCEVHVLAMAANDLPPKQVHDQIRITRLPMPPPIRSAICCAMIPLLWWSRRLVQILVGSPVRLAETRTSNQSGGIQDKPRRQPYSWLGPLRNLTARGMSLRAQVFFIKVERRLIFEFRRVVIRGGYLLRRGVTKVRKAIQSRLFPPAAKILLLNRSFAAQAIALKPDVVHCHDLNTLAAGVVVKRLIGVPLVYDSHELFVERNIGTTSRWKDRALWGRIEKFCIGQCDAVLSVAQSICNHLQRQYRIAPPHLVRNVQPYEPARPRSTLLADELGIPANRAIVIYAGAVTTNRGLEAMIDSAPMLQGSVYVIMGHANNPEFLQSLKRRAKALGQLNRTVYFRDAVPMDRVIEYLASAHAGIVPTQNACLSYYYESSNKIFHCIMAGIPLAMSDHPEKRMIVEEHGVGVLFDETNPAAIADAVNRLLDDDIAYQSMRRNCLRAARSLNWEHEEHRLRSIYAGLLKDRAAPLPAVPLFSDSVLVEPAGIPGAGMPATAAIS